MTCVSRAPRKHFSAVSRQTTQLEHSSQCSSGARVIVVLHAVPHRALIYQRLGPTIRIKSLKSLAEKNPTQIGDPVSLKAETSSTEPTKDDKPNKQGGEKSLKDIAQDKLKKNPSALGDPVSLKAETSNSEPTPDDRGALREKKSKL
nr:hypothetical protein CFP56_00897 [Quercus suber]